MMRILYIGNSNPASTSRHRADALRRLGHEVVHADPYAGLAGKIGSKVMFALHYRTGFRFFQKMALAWCRETLSNINQKIDLVWLDSGELFGPRCVWAIKSTGAPIVFYNIDDVTGNRDGRRFDSIRKCLPLFDLNVVCRKENVHEYIARGARDVMHVFRTYDEVIHAPFSSLEHIPDRFRSEVAFIGSWMPNENRDEFLMDLVTAGVPLSIWGSAWNRSKHWANLQKHHQGGPVYGRDYAAAIQGAKVCIGMLSKGNRDLHTTRSAEVPYAGGVLCAERTSEHTEMYRDGDEALFWSDSKECAAQCLRLLNDDALRDRIRTNGRRRVMELGLGNEDVCRKILDHVMNGISK